jgi:hypothetical protein
MPYLVVLHLQCLIYTILLQRNELNLQREELKLQREELKLQREETSRSADAQEAAELALRAQAAATERTAKLSAISMLISHYSVEISKIQSYSPGTPAAKSHLDLSNRLQALRNKANEAYQELISD